VGQADGSAPGATIAPNLFGLGDSLEEWARAVVEQTEGEQLVVVGASVGGSCALEVAALVPDRVEAIVLAGAKGIASPRTSLSRRGHSGIAAPKGSHLLGQVLGTAVRRAQTRPPSNGARALAFDQPIDDIIRGTRAFHERRDLTDFAHSWTKPLVVISGDQDRVPTPAPGPSSPRRPDGIPPRGRLRHYVNLEQPAVFTDRAKRHRRVVLSVVCRRMSDMQITRIDHVQLAMPPGREHDAVEFYEGLLGIPQVPKPAHLAVAGRLLVRAR
jgi:pimeloyl-ACP methyl ester carboxylesterase